MLNIAQRNLKIFHIIESTISDFCRIMGTSYSRNEEAFIVKCNKEDLFYAYPGFHKNNFMITINCFVFNNLSISKADKLKSIYTSKEIADIISEASVDLWFLNDQTLVTTNITELNNSDKAILKSKLLRDIYINVQNARKLKNKLEALLSELEQIRVN